MSKRKKILISNLYLVLVSGRPGSFRAEPISEQAAPGMDPEGVGWDRPETAWAISGGSGMIPVEDMLGPKSFGSARNQHYSKIICVETF